jgi:hypothetical protein
MIIREREKLSTERLKEIGFAHCITSYNLNLIIKVLEKTLCCVNIVSEPDLLNDSELFNFGF